MQHFARPKNEKSSTVFFWLENKSMGICASSEDAETVLQHRARACGVPISSEPQGNDDGGDMEGIRAEVERRERMPPMPITCNVPDDGEEKEISVKA